MGRPASNTLARFHLQEKLSFIPLHSMGRQSFVLSPHTQDTRQYNKMTLKNLPIVAALSLASISTTVLAQAPITIQGGTYDGQAIAGQHVGAAQSYQVALSQRTGSSLSASGDGFTYNLTSKMYMDWSIVSGQSLPCYIIDEDSIGNGTGGPLECGAATNAKSDHGDAGPSREREFRCCGELVGVQCQCDQSVWDDQGHCRWRVHQCYACGRGHC